MGISSAKLARFEMEIQLTNKLSLLLQNAVSENLEYSAPSARRCHLEKLKVETGVCL